MKKITIDKIKSWKSMSFLSVALFFVLLIIVIFFVLKKGKTSDTIISDETSSSENSSQTENETNTEAKKYLTTPDSYPIAVVIDNQTDARPQYGLSQAKIVYETEAEGGITRYLAIFDKEDDISQIGPVRSARPYFLDWAEEMSAVFTHCGGSPEALARISQEDIIDLNEFYQGNYFWRGEDKQAPHNIYTSIENINFFLENKAIDCGNFINWEFNDNEYKAEIPENNIAINFEISSFAVEWVYKSKTNNYLRYLANEIHVDAGNNENIQTENLVIQYTDMEIIDDKLRLDITTDGSGEAIFCIGGNYQPGTWTKNDKYTEYTYSNGDKVKFNPGRIWIEVVSEDLEVIINS